MYSPNIGNHNPQPDHINEEVEQINEVDVQHPRVAPGLRSHWHLFHVYVVLVAEDPRVGVEAMGAEIQYDENWF